MLLHYRRYGQQGPVLVILHGLFGMSENWQMVARKLEGDMQIVALDLRNHGLSQHATGMKLQTMAEDVAETLDNIGIEIFYLLGHSMGGKVAMELAFQYPQRVLGLMIADIAAKTYKPGHEEIFRAMFEVDFTQVKTRNDIDAQLARRIPEAAVRMFIMKNIERRDDGAYGWRFNLQGIYDGYNDIIGPVSENGLYDGPVAVLYGSKSRYVLPEDRPTMMHHFPNANFIIINGAGHWIHSDKPDETAAEIRAFIL